MIRSNGRKPNTTCLACGKQYYHCKTCDEMKAVNFWRSNACCEEHFKAYMVAHLFAVGEISVEEARSQLQNVVYSDVLKTDTDVARIIRDILNAVNTGSKKKHSKPETVIEPQEQEQVQESEQNSEELG